MSGDTAASTCGWQDQELVSAGLPDKRKRGPKHAFFAAV